MEWNDKPAIGNGWLTAALILFFPLGLLLFLIRIGMHYNLKFQKTGDMKVGGCIFVAFYGVYVVFFTAKNLSGDEAFFWRDAYPALIVLAVMFLLPGICLLWQSRRKRKLLDDRYSIYYDMILYQKVTSIDELAWRVRERRMMVINDVKRMIYLGFFEGAVDEHRIVLYNRPIEDAETYELDEIEDTADLVGEAGAEQSGGLQPKNVECAGCGSRAMVRPGKTAVCEYCGASLVYPA